MSAEVEPVPIKEIDRKDTDEIEALLLSAPIYHDISHPTYVHLDVQEWTSRIKYYRTEMLRNSRRIVNLRGHVKQLQTELEKQIPKFDDLQENTNIIRDDIYQISTQIQQEKLKKQNLLTEINSLKQRRILAQRKIDTLNSQISNSNFQIGELLEELEEEERKHERAFGEKEKLRLEREWLLRQRIILENTSAEEVEDVKTLKAAVTQLRRCMQHAWKDSIIKDTRGLLKAAKLTPYDEEWYSMRKRKFNKKKTSIRQSTVITSLNTS